MTRKQTGTLLILMMVLLGSVFLIRMGRQNSDLRPESTSDGHTDHTDSSSAPTFDPSSVSQASSVTPVERPIRKDKAERMREGLSELNHVPIDFYGKLEDQYGEGIGNQRIDYVVDYNDGLAAGRKKGQTVSDSAGFFSVSGERGKYLGINPKIPGYALIPTNAGARYSALWPKSERHVPDQNHPVVITMWKLKGAEELVEIAQQHRIRSESKAFLFDLVAGRKVDHGGDVAILVKRPPGEVTQRNRQDWSVTITPIDGGIIQVPDTGFGNTFEAPADGYEQVVTLKMDARNPSWFDNIRQGFFLKSRGGQVFSKLSVAVFLNQTEGLIGIHLHGIANANGSRNWEEDPAKIKRVQSQ